MATRSKTLTSVTKETDSCLFVRELDVVYKNRTNLTDLPNHAIGNSSDLANLFRIVFPSGKMELQECFMVAFLNRANKPIGHYLLSIGGMTGTVADPRLLFSTALLCGAVSIALCHNHPSGSLTPSRADETITTQIKEAGKLLDIKLLDHIILTETAFYSFMDEGRI